LPTFLEESALWPILGYVPILGGLYPQTASYARARQVGWVEGAAMAIRRAAFEAVSGFDASYFLYFEEVDLCYRLAAAGWQVHFAPVGTLMHVRGASTRQYRSDTAIMALAGRLHFYRKHYPPWRVAAMVIIVQLVLVARCLLAPVRIRRARSEGQRARLQHEASAWRRALGGEWLRPRARAFTR
jgi:GT2 family glycosyltransferase